MFTQRLRQESSGHRPAPPVRHMIITIRTAGQHRRIFEASPPGQSLQVLLREASTTPSRPRSRNTLTRLSVMSSQLNFEFRLRPRVAVHPGDTSGLTPLIMSALRNQDCLSNSEQRPGAGKTAMSANPAILARSEFYQLEPPCLLHDVIWGPGPTRGDTPCWTRLRQPTG
jgi:hypothetical protein